ncbi:hypothetical protein ACFVAV_32215 [Nocardia sp. NPDC057663]|uniref:RskA family anti-sigma factor n=1 Tax=Nocardia sp. NPDC057663 TaxID=3346201 RepID=UPI003671CF12
MNRQRGPDPAPGGVALPVPEFPSGADDRDALRALYRATGAAAFGLALRVLHRRGSAEDVVREGYQRLRAAPWPVDDAVPSLAAAAPIAVEEPPVPDLGTPWGRSAFAAGLGTETGGDTTFGHGAVYDRDGARTGPGAEHPGEPTAASSCAGRDDAVFSADQTWLLAQVHRLAVQRLRLDRHDGDDIPWLAASARLGFADPLDSHCEVFVLAYYGGRTYRAISRELGLRLPVVTRLLAEGVERLAEQRIVRVGSTQAWCPPGSILALADAYALDAVAELEYHHIENKLAAVAPHRLAQFATRVRGVHDMLARLAVDDRRTPPRHLETRILADLSTAETPRRGTWTTRPPWLRRFGQLGH